MRAEEREAARRLSRSGAAQLVEERGLVVVDGGELADELHRERLALRRQVGGGGGEEPGELGDQVAAAAAQRGGRARELHVPGVEGGLWGAVLDREQLGVALPQRGLRVPRGRGVRGSRAAAKASR